MDISSARAGTNFFLAYAEFVKLDKIQRKGYPLWGVFKLTNEPTVKEDQSDLEHCAGMAFIANWLPMFYPNVYPITDTWKYVATATIHELGELETGDIPDDGTRDNASKDAQERRIINRYIDCFVPSQYQKLLKEAFAEMQNKDTDFGKTMYLIDKTEAILRGFVYEMQGKTGRYSKKPYHTDKDSAAFEFTGVEYLSDCWLCNLLQSINREEYPEEVLMALLEICQSAAKHVRGHSMEWLKRM